jgi:hypothetical protein
MEERIAFDGHPGQHVRLIRSDYAFSVGAPYDTDVITSVGQGAKHIALAYIPVHSP